MEIIVQGEREETACKSTRRDGCNATIHSGERCKTGRFQINGKSRRITNCLDCAGMSSEPDNIQECI